VPSRCHEASLPKDFSRDANMMRNLRQHMITEPRDRYERTQILIENFTKADILKEWNAKVSENFTQIKAKQLYHPKVLDPRDSER
jgi:hypothetical protein